MPDGITVLDVFRALRIEPTPAATWSVGSRAMHAYVAETGHEPPKGLRRKTSGGGSHCFAIYPESMRPTIEALIREHGAEDARQGSLL